MNDITTVKIAGVITPDVRATVDAIVEQAVALPEEVTSEVQALATRSVMNGAGKYRKAIEATQKQALSPYEEAKKRLKAEVEEITSSLVEVEEGCKQLLAAYVVKTQAENRQAEDARQAREAEAPVDDRPTRALVLDAPEQKTVSVVPMTTVTDVVIVDEALIPEMYWKLDRVAVRKDALAGVKIPGVEVRIDKVIANR